MKAYIKNDSEFDYPDEMEKILNYLNKWGTLKISPKKVEKLYRQYSEEMWCAGWMSVCDQILSSFADWLSEVEIVEIDAMPTADVEEVRHAHWINDGKFRVCSACWFSSSKRTIGAEYWKYCPYCGAKMDGEEK